MSDLENKTGLRVKGRLMSASEIERTLVRLAHEIVEKSNGSEDLALVGIKRRGVPLAERLGKLICHHRKAARRYGSPRHSVLSRRSFHGGRSTGGHAGSRRLRCGGPRHRDLRRRALHRPHHPRRARCALRPWPAPPRATGRANRPRPSRAAHRGHLRGQSMCPQAAARLSKSSSRKSTPPSKCCSSRRPIKVRSSICHSLTFEER